MRTDGARWAVSFADLCLLLVGFLVIAQARADRPAIAASVRQAFGETPPDRARLIAARLFQPGEAVLTDRGRAEIAAIAARAKTGSIRIDSAGADRATTRLDGWELAAARTASVARALVWQGVPEERITLAIARTDEHPQVLDVTLAK